MAFQSASGASLSIVKDAPATFDDTGYVALTFVTVGEITNIGEFGKEWALVTHQPLAKRGTGKAKGSYNNGQLSPTLALDVADAGQILAKEALNSDDEYSFEIALQDGTKFYARGIVMMFKPNVGSIDDVVTASMTVELTDQDIVQVDPT